MTVLGQALFIAAYFASAIFVFSAVRRALNAIPVEAKLWPNSGEHNEQYE